MAENENAQAGGPKPITAKTRFWYAAFALIPGIFLCLGIVILLFRLQAYPGNGRSVSGGN
jgi:hypothetical protein